jgi:RNA polymerase sigma-70 factor (ECF subfamily)
VSHCAELELGTLARAPALGVADRRAALEDGRVSSLRPDDLAARSDEDLVALSREGSRDAFEELVRRHQRTVYQVCYRFSGRHEDAADLAQETLLRAWRSLGAFRGEARFSTWLYRVAVNTALARSSKSRAAEQQLDEATSLVSTGDAPDEGLDREARQRQVRAAIAQLPKRQRTTLILRVYHELTHEQIAATMGGSVGTAKANLFHALRNLRTLLTKETAS